MYAVTGATGYLGGRVARALATAGVEQRLVVRDASRAPVLPGADVAVASYDDFSLMVSAFSGAQTLFMVSAAEHENRVAQHLQCVDAAVAAGVERIVYTSIIRAAPDAVFTLARDHWATEERIRASGLAWTFLRDNLYADFAPLLIGDDDVIRGPGGDGRVAVVVRDDIADVAARVLVDGSVHDGQTYDLTGPEALTLSEIAALLTSALGRTVTYYPETIEEAYASRATYGAPDWMVDAWVTTYTTIAQGNSAEVTDNIERITGHPATSLAEFLARP